MICPDHFWPWTKFFVTGRLSIAFGQHFFARIFPLFAEESIFTKTQYIHAEKLTLCYVGLAQTHPQLQKGCGHCVFLKGGEQQSRLKISVDVTKSKVGKFLTVTVVVVTVKSVGATPDLELWTRTRSTTNKVFRGCTMQ